MDGRAELDALRRNCRELIAGLDGPMLDTVLNEVGLEVKPLVESGVASELGDTSMSGWRRGAPVKIAGRYDIFTESAPDQSSAEQSLVVRPTPRARGPMRVLERGRHMGNAGGIAGPAVIQTGDRAGQTRRRKNGTIAVSKPGRAKRWNGYTRPQQTWSEISALIERRAPELADRAIVNTILRAMAHGR